MRIRKLCNKQVEILKMLFLIEYEVISFYVIILKGQLNSYRK